MFPRPLIPALALLTPALYAQAPPQPEQTEQETRFTMRVEQQADEEGAPKRVFSMGVQGTDDDTGEDVNWKVQVDLSELENIKLPTDAPKVTFDSLRRQMEDNMRFHAECMRSLRALASAPTKASEKDLQQIFEAQKARFIAHAAKMMQLRQAVDEQGVQLQNDPAYAEVMGAYRRVTAEQFVEWDMLISDLHHSDAVEGFLCVMALSVGIVDTEVDQKDLRRQMIDLRQRCTIALSNVKDMMSIIANAEAADAMADILEDRARDAEKCRLLMEWYLKDRPTDVAAAAQPLTTETMRALLADVMKRLKQADYFGCERLKKLADRYEWLHEKGKSYTLSFDSDDDESVEVKLISAKDPATGESVTKGMDISVRSGSPAADPPPAAQQEPPSPPPAAE